jgi:serine phosphatase RsbU (regulator of sigma subunit)
VQLEDDDLLLLYTDGITEAMAPLNGADRRDLFGLERLDQLLVKCGRCTVQDCIKRVRESVTSFGDTTLPSDDQTLIAIRCCTAKSGQARKGRRRSGVIASAGGER